MLGRLFFFAAILFLVPVGAAFGQLRGAAMSSSFTFYGEEYRYSLDTDGVKETPLWRPLQGDPPLLVSQAASIANENAKSIFKRTDGFKISKIELEELDTDRWYYRVHFRCLACSEIGGFDMIVKMDGKFLIPEITKKK